MTTAVPAVRNAVRTWLENFEAGDTILVAVSGGADSLALAHALSIESKEFAISIMGVSVDHQLQEQSGAQADKVKAQLKEFGVDCIIKKVTVNLKAGLEASARKARYEALQEVAKDKNDPVYVTCAVGQRAYYAIQILRNNGYKNIYNLTGGYSTYTCK